MTTRTLLLIAAAAALFAAPALAQQPGPPGQSDSTPTLTNDDIAPPAIVTPLKDDSNKPPPADDSALTPEEKADAAGAPDKGAPSRSGKKGPSAAELNWRGRLTAAQNRVRAADRTAEEAEIHLTDLRNQLSAGRTSNRDPLIAEIGQQADVIKTAQQQAQAAHDDLAAVVAEGQRRGYRPDPGPSRTTKSGQPNADYYVKRYTDAKAALDDAERRITMYQFRANDARGRLTTNAGSGDQLTQFRIQGDITDALDGLAKAQADRDVAQDRVDAALQEASAAGVRVQ